MTKHDKVRDEIQAQLDQMLLGRSHPLLDTLELMVPLRILELQGLDLASVELIARGRPRVDTTGRPLPSENAALIGQCGDQLIFGGPACRATLAALVDGLAGLALLCPGGVRAFGMHWEARHPDVRK